MPATFTDIAKSRYVLLTTFTKDGRPKPTPIWLATDSGCDDRVSRSLAELLLDYGEGYIGSGPLCWSPGEVMLLLTDWLPRKAILDTDQRAALPDVPSMAVFRPHPTRHQPLLDRPGRRRS